MTAPIDKAFILAAGLGTRMRPLTDTVPKPMLRVQGRTLLEQTLGHLEKDGIKDCVINTHHLPHIITQGLSGRNPPPRIEYAHEPVLLDTGGGIKKMLHFFKNEPFFVLAGDGLWTDKNTDKTALSRLSSCWSPKKMDILILLQSVARMTVTHGAGDYDILPGGLARRSKAKTGSHMFTSIRINAPAIFDDTPEGPFSYLSLLDRAEEKGRLFGLEHTGDWHHLSTPADLDAVELALGKTA